MSTLLTFEKRAVQVKEAVSLNKGFMPRTAEAVDGQLTEKNIQEYILTDMEAAVKQLNALRTGGDKRVAIDLSWAEFIREKWGFAISENGAPDSFYHALGVNPAQFTIENLMTMPEFDSGYRWLMPEIIREAIRLGSRKPSIYSALIAAEESVSQTQVTMPFINLSDATPSKVGEAETIPVGTTSYGQKTVKLNKYGTGLKITDEVQQYVPLNILSLYLQDVGVKLNSALDTKAVDILINGDQADGSESAPIIGVETTTAFAYKDMLRLWIRMGMLGRLPSGILSNEAQALEVLLLPEFKGYQGQTKDQTIKVSTPVPASQNYWIHGAMPSTNKIMFIDTTSALIKLNAQALRVESERIVERQLSGTYVTLTTGFANLFRDARVIMDKSLAFSSYGFPSYMDAAAAMNVAFKG